MVAHLAVVERGLTVDTFTNLALGFGEALTLTNLAFCLIGVLLGTLIGVLPGLGPAATIAMLLPTTFALPPSAALIMIAGIYYGAQYGGSTTAILINIPGEATSIMTAVDGHQMALQGRAGIALSTAAIGSFIAGTISTAVIAFGAPVLAEVALSFGPAEYFSLMVAGLVGSVVLASGSILKAIGMIFVGILLGFVGTDTNSGAERFTLGMPELVYGLSFISIAMGMFGIAEIIKNLEDGASRTMLTKKVAGLMPSREDWGKIWAPILRGTFLGSALGLLPGGGALLASFASYAVEKRVAHDPSEFGKGAIQGVAGPESANNAGAQSAFIPMLTLGIPSNAVLALMVGALMIQGIAPGPQVMSKHPELFWGLIASMWIGNLFLLILNLPLIGLWVKLLTIPYHYLYPAILIFCGIGALSINNQPVDIWIMAIFGIFGYVMHKLDCEPAPLLLGIILGKMVEEYLRRALLISRGDAMVFIERPISALLLLAALVALIAAVIPAFRRKREEALEE